MSTNGLPLTSSQVSTCVWRTFQREGVQRKGTGATIIRKSLAIGMHVHMPEERDHLAALSQHKKQTQEKYYRVLDKVIETDLRRSENSVKTAKNILKKAADAGYDPHLSLLDFRNTPSEGMDSSPAQRLFSRRART